MLRTTTLRPGFLVSLKTSLTGNVSYSTATIESDHETAAGELKARWETERTVSDPAEHEAGIKARSAARTAITRLCSTSTFGLLCPETRGDELAAAIAEARAVADKFNATAGITRLNVGVIVGRVAADDAEAVRAINAEVRGLLDEMTIGLRRLDVDAVRDAAQRARSMGQMLTPNAAERVQVAIDAARSTARRMVRAGEQAAREIDAATLASIASARTAFLDLDEAPAIGTVTATTARALDLDPAETAPAGTVSTAAPRPQFALEL